MSTTPTAIIMSSKNQKMEGSKKPKLDGFYFELPDEDLYYLSLDKFEARLLSCLAAAFRTGLMIVEVKNGNTLPFIDSTQMGVQVKKYIMDAATSHLKGDKFISLRLLGPSLAFIKTDLPDLNGANIQQTSDNILLLCVWRVFGVGSEERLQKLKEAFYSSPASSEGLKDIRALIPVIESYSGEHKFLNSAYGNFMVDKAKFEGVLIQLAIFSRALAGKLAKKEILTFRALYDDIVGRKIPTIINGGIIPWLFCGDFSEYGVCHPPTVADLVAHMTAKMGTKGSALSGPTKALARIEEWAGKGGDLLDCLTKVMGVIQNPPAGMSALQTLVEDCEIQGRKLNVVDLEHALCKIGRMMK